VGYYAVRDLAYRRNDAYWENCEREWKRSKPAAYPSFHEWVKASEQCGDDVLDKYEMCAEKRRLIKLMHRVGSRTLRQAVERYVEWEVFAFWTRAALEGEFRCLRRLKRKSGEGVPASWPRKMSRAARIRQKKPIADSTDWSNGLRTTSLPRLGRKAGLMCFATKLTSMLGIRA